MDYRSGAKKTTCTLFPFSISEDDTTDGFRVLFGSSADENADWGRVDCRHLIASLDQEAITDTQAMVHGENCLVGALLYNPVVHDEANTLSKSFYAELRAGGTDAADRYAHDLYLKRTAQSLGR